uniref:Uncharacterized protein n=1 Tax=mine drainage metagenome TaxID=410659 RepID=E6PVE3_9ZZZZ
MMCGAGHNICLILKKLRLLCPRIARAAMHAVGSVWGASFYRNASGWLKTLFFRMDSVLTLPIHGDYTRINALLQ